MDTGDPSGSGVMLRSAAGIAVFVAVCAAIDFLAPLPGDGARFPPPGWTPRVIFYTAATLLFFLSGAPALLDRRRLFHLIFPMVLAAAAAVVLPDGFAGRMFFLGAASGIALVLGRLVAQAGSSPADLVGIFLTGAACDALICGFDIYECPVIAGPWTLRPPGLSGGTGPWTSVPVPDLVFLGALLEMSRRYGFGMAAAISGTWTGFAGASMLQTAARCFVPAIPVVGAGVLIAAWPKISMRGRDLRRAILAMLAVCLALASIVAAKRLWLDPPRPLQPRLEDLRYSV
ncbi:MAG: hypothetical protein N3A38_09565 [Planctomycetota bacterium]|nr:hypothetical protein [Planctomycetota bacterium]